MAQSKYLIYPLITWWFSIVMLVHQRVSISTALLLVYGWHYYFGNQPWAAMAIFHDISTSAAQRFSGSPLPGDVSSGSHQSHQSHQPEPGITSSQQIGQVFHPAQARETLRTWKALRVERSKSINMGTEANMGVCVPSFLPVWKNTVVPPNYPKLEQLNSLFNHV